MQKKPALGSITSKGKGDQKYQQGFFHGHWPCLNHILRNLLNGTCLFVGTLKPSTCLSKDWNMGRDGGRVGGWHSRIATSSTVCWTNRKNPFPFHDFCFVKAKKRIKQQRVMFSSIWTISTIWGILMHNQLVLANVEFSSRDAGEKWTIRITSMISGRARTSIEDWMGLLGEGLVKRLALSVVYVELEI